MRSAVVLALLLSAFLAAPLHAQWTHRYPKVEGYSHHVYLEGFELPILTAGPMDPAPSPDGTTDRTPGSCCSSASATSDGPPSAQVSPPLVKGGGSIASRPGARMEHLFRKAVARDVSASALDSPVA